MKSMKKAIKNVFLFSFILAVMFTSTFAAGARNVLRTYKDGNISWRLYSDKDLVISGKGEITSAPDWYGEEKIRTLTVKNGITDIVVRKRNRYIKHISLPDSMTKIGDHAFTSYYSLESVDLPSGLKYIGDYAFYGCEKLDIRLPKSVTEIGVGAFSGCSITKLDLSENLVKIGSGAFVDNDYTTLKIPNSITIIEKDTFCAGGKLESVTLSKNTTKLSKRAFSGCTRLESIAIPNKVEEISTGAFSVCMSLKSIEIPENVKKIGKDAFACCNSLKYAIIRNPKCNIDINVGFNTKGTEGDPSYVQKQFPKATTIIFGYKNSTAEEYAKNTGLVFYPLDKGSTEHCYTSSKVTKQPTCKTEGEMTYYCPCGYENIEKIEKTNDHTFKTYITPATMKANGANTVKCKNCGKVENQSKIKKISSVKLSKTSFTYNGKTQKPSVTVKDSKGRTLKNGTDYTVKYSKGCKNVGQYTVTITFKGKYSGTKTLTFKIVPKGTSISKLTAGKKQFTAKWSKQTAQTTGYELQYSTKSSMSGAKTVTVGKNKTTSSTVKKLKSGKKYYVRVRTYKTVKINGKSVKIYSSWSKVKSVKTK